jgi:hypothetical protein
MKNLDHKFSNIKLQTANILAIYKQANSRDISEGKNWYIKANDISRLMAVKYKLCEAQTAGIIAALSPGANWPQNIIDANNLCSLLGTGKDINRITCTTYNANKLKAAYIYSHSELSENEIFVILLGSSKKVNKTSSFYLNILHPELSDNITIDRHSSRVNLGTDINLSHAPTEKRYKFMEAAYKIASNQLQISAIELQAITWITFRRLNSIIRDKQFEEVPF